MVADSLYDNELQRTRRTRDYGASNRTAVLNGTNSIEQIREVVVLRRPEWRVSRQALGDGA